MTEKEAELLDLLSRALYDLKEHRDEYQHRGQIGLIAAIEAKLKENEPRNTRAT